MHPSERPTERKNLQLRDTRGGTRRNAFLDRHRRSNFGKGLVEVSEDVFRVLDAYGDTHKPV